MNATYDARTDTLSIVLTPSVAVAESDEHKSGLILDRGAAGKLISLQVLGASKRVPVERRIEFEVEE